MKEGVDAYIIENNLTIRKVTIVNITGNIVLVRFDNGGGIKVRLNRLFDSEDSAKRYLNKNVSENYNGQLM